MKKTFRKLMILVGLSLSASLSAESGSYFRILNMPGYSTAISDNGKWVISSISQTAAFLYNDETGVITELLTPEIGACEAYDVSDDGMVVGNADELPAYYLDGKWHFLDLPEGYGQGNCKQVSQDGSIIYGEMINGLYFTPVVWKNGVPELMTTLSRDLFNKVPGGGFIMVSASGDGSRVAGRVIDYEYSWYPVLWNEDTPSYLCTDLFKDAKGKSNGLQLRVANLSNNGNFISLDIIEYVQGEIVRYPYVWNIGEEILTPLDGDFVCVVDNNGRAFSCSPQGSLNRTSYVHENGSTFLLEDWLLQNFGLDMITEYSILYSGTPIGISADGRTLTGYCTNNENFYNYIIRLDSYSGSGIDDSATPKPVVFTRGSEIIISAQTGSAVIITDLSGRILHRDTMKENSGSVSMQPGTYVVQIRRDSSVFTFKTIIHH